MATPTYPTVEEMKPLSAQAYQAYHPGAFMRGPPVVMGQPQTAEASPIVAPPGAPTVGLYIEDRYCGLTSWLIALVGAFPCAYFCPCDRRTVWLANGVKYNEKGAIVDDYLFHNPCPQGSMCNPPPRS